MSDTRFDDFVSVLKAKLKAENLSTSYFHYNTMSDGTVNFMYKDWQIGRVYFGKKVSRMQIIDDDKVEWVNNKSLDYYISRIPKWIEYVKHLEENENFLK